jgi:hypothetical protein
MFWFIEIWKHELLFCVWEDSYVLKCSVLVQVSGYFETVNHIIEEYSIS